MDMSNINKNDYNNNDVNVTRRGEDKLDTALRIMHGFANSIPDSRLHMIFIQRICARLEEAVNGIKDYPTVEEIQAEFFYAIGMGEEYAKFLQLEQQEQQMMEMEMMTLI
jgi:hypothetical protein